MRKYIFILFAIYLIYVAGCGGTGNINSSVQPADNFLTSPGVSSGTFTVKIDLPQMRDLTGQVIPWQRKYIKVIFLSGDGITAPVTFPDPGTHPNGQDIDTEGTTLTATGIPLGLKTVRIEISDITGKVIAQRTLGFYMERTGYNAGNIQMGIAIDSSGNCNPSTIEISFTGVPVTLYVENQGSSSRSVKINSVVQQLNGVVDAVQPSTPSVYDVKSFDFTSPGTYGIFAGNGGEADPSTHKGDVIIYSPVTITSFTPSTGQGGTEVTITGENFDSATPANNTVKFNGTTAASITVDSATQIRAIVPSGATSGKISVTTKGSTATSSTDFNILTITSFSPSSGQIGSEVTITGEGFDSATPGNNTVKFNNTNAVSITVDSSTQIRAIVPSGATSGKISVTVSGKTATSATDFSALDLFLYVNALNESPDIFGYSIDHKGSLSRVAYLSGNRPVERYMAADPLGRFLYATDTDRILSFVIDGSGGLGFGGIINLEPTGLTADPSGNFLYATAPYNSNSSYTVGGGGSLTFLSSQNAGTGTSYGISVTPSGKFLYSINKGSSPNMLYTYSITDGKLSLLSSVYYADNEEYNRSIAIDPSGKFLYVANAGPHTISAFAIDNNTGSLSSLGSPFSHPSMQSAEQIIIDPSGKFLYVRSGFYQDSIYICSIDSVTGSLSYKDSASTPHPSDMAIDPSGKFLYVSNSDPIQYAECTVTGFNVNQSTGALTPVENSPFYIQYSGIPYDPYAMVIVKKIR